MNLADILVEEGRYEEAEQLTRVAVDINRTVGLADDSQATVTPLAHLAGILRLERKNEEATAIFNQIDAAVAKWDPQRRQAFELNPSRILSLYASNQLDAGIAAAQQLVKRQVQRVGENHFDAASAHGTLAIGLMRAGRDGDAIREFKAAIPVMLANAQENADDEDTTLVAARSLRLQTIVESYFTLLARSRGGTDAVGEETFSLADSVRGHTVQQALAASSARAAAHDPALADLVRKEQDLTKQVNAQLGALNNVLAIPSSERDEKGVQQIQAAITTQRAERDKARLEIKQKFPAYAELVSPKPPNVQEIRATLADGEAMLSFYFGQDSAFVWAVPKSGPIAFAAVNAKIGDVESKIRKLREALEPQAAMISDIPPFDLKLGYELYELLLKPVESDWKPAKNLIVVTNGALGLLPCRCCRRHRQKPRRRRAAVRRLSQGTVARQDPTRSRAFRRRQRCARCGNCRPARPAAADWWPSAIPISTRISNLRRKPPHRRSKPSSTSTSSTSRCRPLTPAAASRAGRH